jgi:hypothetical protein
MKVTLAETTTGTVLTEETEAARTGAFLDIDETVNEFDEASTPSTGLAMPSLLEMLTVTGALLIIEVARSSIDEEVGIQRAVKLKPSKAES